MCAQLEWYQHFDEDKLKYRDEDDHYRKERDTSQSMV